MTQFAAGDAVFSFDNASDSLQDVSSSIQSVTLDAVINGTTYHTFGSRHANAQEGGIAYTVTINLYDDTSATSLAGYLREWLLDASNKGGARTFRIEKPDGTTGSTRFDMEVKPGGNAQLANLTAGSGDPAALSITLNVDGAVTETTIS